MPLIDTLKKWFGDTNPVGNAMSVLSTIGGGVSSLYAMKRQKKLMDYQDMINDVNYRRQLADKKALIEDERQYNDFSSVLARAKAAGVHPNTALGLASGAGLQSSAGEAPSSAASSIASPDNMAQSLLTTGSTLSAQIRQSELLDAEKRRLEAEAETAEIDAKWADKNYAQEYESKEIHKQMQTIDLGTATQRARYTTAVAEMAELKVDEFKELKPERILSYKTSLSMSIEQLAQMKLTGEYQREFIITELDKRNAEISAIRTGEVVSLMDANTNRMNANTNVYNAETARKQYGLSEKEFNALQDYRSELIRLHDEDQELQERYRKQQDKHHKQNLTKDYILGVGGILERRAEIKAQIQEKQQSAISRFGESIATALIFKGVPL